MVEFDKNCENGEELDFLECVLCKPNFKFKEGMCVEFEN